MPRRSAECRPTPEISPRAKIWFEVNGQYAFGRGISDILKAVDRSGSIKAAADELGKSYRYVWAKIKATERSLGESLVRTQVGGKDARRSDLTDLARRLVADFDALREDLCQRLDKEFAQRVRGKRSR
jgi:molybdate transport system regulatory protein